MQKAKELLKKIVNKKNVYLTESCDYSIEKVLEMLNKPKVIIPDQGGWLSYKKFGNIEVKTNHGLIDLNDLKEKADENSVLLVNSLGGYIALQNMEEISNICKAKKCIIINDVSGSIGTKEATSGDIIVGSFSRWKPIDLGYGGFIASDKKLEIKENFDLNKINELKEKILNLNKRRKFLISICNKIKKDLNNYEIIHKNEEGLVVVVKFNNTEEKEGIIKYCNNKKLEYTICPRYIRVNENAVSIEVKRC